MDMSDPERKEKTPRRRRKRSERVQFNVIDAKNNNISGEIESSIKESGAVEGRRNCGTEEKSARTQNRCQRSVFFVHKQLSRCPLLEERVHNAAPSKEDPILVGKSVDEETKQNLRNFCNVCRLLAASIFCTQPGFSVWLLSNFLHNLPYIRVLNSLN